MRNDLSGVYLYRNSRDCSRVYKSDIHEMGWKSVDEMVKAKNYKERK